MTFTIGRISLPDNFDSWSESGRSVSATIDLFDGSQSVAWHVRQRENLANLVGRVEPVTSTDDPTIDGFYRVDAVSVGSVPASLSSGFFPVTLDLTALPHKRTAVVEISTSGADRTGTPVTAQPWLAVPGSATAWSDGNSYTRPMVDPDDPGATAATVSFRTSTSSPDYYDDFSQVVLAPASRYASAPRVEFDGIQIHGRQDQDDFADVVVTNGGLRISKGTSALFSVEVVDLSGSSPYDWGTAFEVGPGYHDTVGTSWTSFDPDDVVGIQVLAESSDFVAIRAIASYAIAPLATFDLYLRRGAWYGELVTTTSDLDSSYRLGMYLENTSTTLTGNYSIRTATIEGARYFVGMGVDSTVALADDAIYTDSHATKVRSYFGFGDPSGTSDDTPADVQAQAWTGQVIRETIAAVRV